MAGIVAALILFNNVNFANIRGSGRVLDYKTHEPIPAADLTGTCRRPTYIHGSRTLKTLLTRSGPDGRYTFDFGNTWHCSEFELNAWKPGYVRLIEAAIPNLLFEPDGSVPTTVWLVKETDVAPLRLQGLFAAIQKVDIRFADGSGRRDYALEFTSTVDSFERAEKTAATDAERAWVWRTFCPLLRQRFAAIPAAERPRPVAGTAEYDKYIAHWQTACAR